MRVTTHTEGRVVTHEHDEPIEVAQLPNRDAAAAAASGTVSTSAPKTAEPASAQPDPPAKQAVTPAVKAAKKQQTARTTKGKKRR
jgi:hypothetical protein